MDNTIEKVINQLVRPELIDMVPYQSARRLQAMSDPSNCDSIWLNANESAGDGRYELNGQLINRYPDFQPEPLINAYSEYAQQPIENVLATRGADEGIELIIRTFCRAYQDSILICPPTYGMYAISAENHGADIVKVPLVENQLDVDGIKAQIDKVKVLFLCSPGNPTGNLLNQDDIKTIIEAASDKAMVVVDEAYIEFSPENSAASWIAEYPNLIVLRTLSKAFALAGLRCGFTLSNSQVITMLSKIIAPYPISAPVAEIAAKALTGDDLAEMKSRVEESNSLRASFSAWLTEQSWCSEVFPSDANFVLFRTKLKQQIFDALKAEGILIRDQSKQQQLENCLRVSIGSERELELLKQTISQAV